MYSMARTRERIRMGTSMRSEKANKEIQKETEIVAKIIQATLKFDGLWFFQMKFDENNILKLLEIETRVAGTMAFSRCLGVNLPLANLYLIEGINVKINPQKFDIIIDRSLANRYITNIEYDTVYVDLDHTIILDEKLNLDLIKFIYQCINREIRIILISKSIAKNKIKYLTLYAFSTENWKRPKKEIKFLFNLLEDFLVNKIEDLHKQNIKLKIIGAKNFSSKLNKLLNKSEKKTSKNNKLQINLALNYGSKFELVNAFKDLKKSNERITEQNLSKYLQTKDIPDRLCSVILS